MNVKLRWRCRRDGALRSALAMITVAGLLAAACSGGADSGSAAGTTAAASTSETGQAETSGRTEPSEPLSSSAGALENGSSSSGSGEGDEGIEGAAQPEREPDDSAPAGEIDPDSATGDPAGEPAPATESGRTPPVTPDAGGAAPAASFGEVVLPLTGEVTTDLSALGRRAVAVKVDNGGLAPRPQFGLADADVVYEVLVEGGFTRFMAVFHSAIPDRIGPVRSVRSSDIDLIADLGVPYLASSGANPVVLRELRAAVRAGSVIDAGALRGVPAYSLDAGRRAPHNRFFHYPELLASSTADPAWASVAPLFDYGDPNPGGAPAAAGVTVTWAGYGNVSSHIWDAGVGGWVRIQRGDLHTTETGLGTVEIAPTNVVVLWLPYKTSAADPKSPQALSFGSGEALLLTAGAVHTATWERTPGRAGYRFTSAGGDTLSLSPGPTWVLLANQGSRRPRSQVTTVSAIEGARMLAEARAAAGAAQQ